MGGQIMVSAGVLKWALGRESSDRSPEPWELRDVEEDGSAIWLASEVEEGAGARMVKSRAVPVPDEKRSCALQVRNMLVEAKTIPEFAEGGALIDFASNGSGDLSIFSDWRAMDRAPVKGLGRWPGKFKKRKKR